MLETLTKETFEPIIGSVFKLTTPEGEIVDFTLVDVEDLPAGGRRRRGPRVKRVPFSVFFTGLPLLAQGMYPMQHDAFGSEPAEIFIVPIGKNTEGEGYEYEAVFT